MREKMCEINGQRYVTPSVFGKWCGWSQQKITAACEDGRIIGADKDTSDKWIIPVNACKPLEIDTIREVLVTVVYLKNRPDSPLDYSDHNAIVSLYTYLQHIGYLEPFNPDSNRIPYEVVLTEKGMKLATEGKSLNLNWLTIGTTVIQVAASLITIGQVFVG